MLTHDGVILHEGKLVRIFAGIALLHIEEAGVRGALKLEQNGIFLGHG